MEKFNGGVVITRAEIIEWIGIEFKPLSLATPDTTIAQIVDNAISYWNTNSAYKIIRMVDYMNGAKFVNTPVDIKTVVTAYPSAMTGDIVTDHPMWMLLGFVTLDKYTSDLMLMSHSFEGYKVFLGADFRYFYVRSEDPDVPGVLYVMNMPAGATKLALTGTKRILSTEDIKDEFIYNWVRYYTKALVKIAEGNTLRKAMIISVQNDGDTLVNEGKEEKKELEDKLRAEGRWLLLASRGRK